MPVIERDRFVCPFCRREAFGSTDMCGGSFTDTGHPSVVRPVFIPAGEDEDRITAEARASYAR
jgi:hypothetical protein